MRMATGFPRLEAPPGTPGSGLDAAAAGVLRAFLEGHAAASATAFDRGTPAAVLVRLRAAAVADVLRHAWRACVGEAGGCALFAVGGFGRGVLFPHSDVDVLVLATAPVLASHARRFEGFFAGLWDIGLAPGHAVRTPADCHRLAAADASVFTSLLDARLLTGDRRCAAALAALRGDPRVWPPRAFLAAKRDEQARRHARFGGTAYQLEPNLKEGPGGLRTLDLMRWLGRRILGEGGLGPAVAAGVIEAGEAAALREAAAVLARDRFALHLEAGRAEERLLFDHQRSIAARLGYRDEHATNLGVEQFMQDYYRAATTVERMGNQVLERLDEYLEPPDPAVQPVAGGFQLRGGRLEPGAADLFLDRPAAIVEIFDRLLDLPHARGLSAAAHRGLQEALGRHGAGLARNREVLAAFRALLQRGAAAVTALAAMNRHGVLAAVLPPFGRIIGRMQYDLFHAYTVDEHTMQVLRNVAGFADPASEARFPMAPAIFAELEKPDLLLLAALFHDIAKGRGGDHSVLGEAEARSFGQRLGLAEAETDLVAWLVRHHLLMSATAQRQDITDPDVVHRFAVAVADRERLDHLYLLTIADIAGTNPGLWNDWKARLLADLHVAARFALRSGLERPPHAGTRMAEARARSLALLGAGGVGVDEAGALLARFPVRAFLRLRPEQLAAQARAIAAAPAGPVVHVSNRPGRGSSELFVHAPDRDGLFAAITATLDRLGCSIVSARLFVSGGQVFDTFELLDGATAAPLEAAAIRALEHHLREQLAAAPDSAREPVRRGLPRRLRHFQRPPQLQFSDAGAATQLALVCSDRPGVLAEVAQALRQARVRVHDARIATFGERVEDFFLLTDEADRPLDAAAQQRLAAILRRALEDPGYPEHNKEP